MSSGSKETLVFAVASVAALGWLHLRRTTLRYLPSASEGGKVVSLLYYPIKGCRAVELKDTAELTSTGIKYDRKWLIVDKDNVFMTQRRMRKLALLEVEVQETSTSRGSEVVLKLRVGDDAMNVVVCEDKAKELKEPVVVWEKQVFNAVDQGKEASDWLSRVFNRQGLRLVYMGKRCQRKINPKYANAEGALVSFADGYPLLLTTEDSLKKLNGRMRAPLPMSRFRPNVVVSGVRPFEEDSWAALTIGNVTFDNAKPCSRCIVTTIDQTTAKMHGLKNDPIKTLQSFRQDADGDVYFGVNLIQRNPDNASSLRIGDSVSIHSRKRPPRFV